MRFFFVASLLCASGCQLDEYLLTGAVTPAGEFRLLPDGNVLLGGELSLERGAGSANRGSLRLWLIPGGCELGVLWPIDARGETSATGQLSCPNVETLDGTVNIVGLEVDSVGETSSEAGARLTIDLSGLRLRGAAVAEGRGTLSFGSLSPGGAGGGAGGGTGGGGGGSGSGGGSCANVPRTYIGDVQFDSICAAAVCYQRIGKTVGVRASCQSLAGLSGPSPSQCPAC